jgi:cytochrome P450
MNLARMEGRIALDKWLKRFPNYELAGTPQRNRRARFRGFASLSITLN